MLSRKIWLSMSFVAAVGWLFATPTAQSVVNEPVHFTFDGPVTLPGQTLPAGKYEFRVMNSSADRQIVEVYSADGRKIGAFGAIAASRPDAPEKPEVRFLETPANMPQAIATWWYPGITRGHEFLYPKEQAEVLVALNAGGVAVAEGESGFRRMSAAQASAPPQPPTNQGQPAPASPVMPPEPPAPPASSAARPSSPAPEPAMPDMTQQPAADGEPRETLPQTAGELPAIALAGLLSLAAGIGLLKRRRAA